MDESQLRVWANTTPLEARFWIKVQIVDDDTSCWLWRAAIHPEGYGLFQWLPPGETKRRAVNAQRVALYLTTGVVPTVACHRCHVRACVRPSHLYDGTHQSNGRDKALSGRAKGRLDQRGELNHYARLTDEKVLSIRAAAAHGTTHDTLAAQYEVTRPTITYIVQGKTWRHLL